jgi:hypothetical protein
MRDATIPKHYKYENQLTVIDHNRAMPVRIG